MLLATALALLITGCACTGRLLFKTNRQQQHQRKPSPIISSFLELGRRKLSMQPKFVAAQKMLLKQKPSKHSGMDCSVLLLFRHLYSAGSACIAHTLRRVAHRYGQLYLHCSLTYLGFLPGCFCIVTHFLSRVK